MTEDKIKWSYLAGIFDGEGNINIRSKPRKAIDYRNGKEVIWNRSLLQMCIANTKLTLMKWLIQNFGGVYYTVKHDEIRNWKDSYIWKPKGQANMKKFLLGILPYSLIKQEQIKLALLYINFNGKGTVEQYKELAIKCRLLNQKGKPVTTNTLDTEESVKIESELHGDMQSASLVTANA